MSDEQTELLRSIAKDVAAIKAAMVASVSANASALGVVVGGSSGNGSGGKPGAVATAAELEDTYGDPLIKFDPKRWSGQSYVGVRLSETSPEYLDCLADFKEWAAGKDDASGAVDKKGKPKSYWAWKEAALARGWAARMRSGWKPKATNGGGMGGQAPVSDEDYGGSDDDGIPF